MLEKQIEARFVKEVEKLGALVLKMTSPSMVGLPDRIILFNSRTIFAELKRPNENLRKIQLYRKKQLEKLGFKVYKIDSYKAITEFIKEVFKNEKI